MINLQTFLSYPSSAMTPSDLIFTAPTRTLRYFSASVLAATVVLCVPQVALAGSSKQVESSPAKLGTVKNDKNDAKSSTKDQDGTTSDKDNGSGNDKNADTRDHIEHDWNGVGWGHENHQGNGYGHVDCDDDTGGGGGGGGEVLVPVDIANTTGSLLSVPLQGTILLSASLNAGSQPVTYQWMWRNSLGAYATIPGATSLSLTIPNATSANNGEYWIVATNSLGSMSSTVTSVVVTSSLSVVNITNGSVADSSQMSILPGGSGTLEAQLVSGTEPVTYQWMQKVNGVVAAVPGATSLTYTITNADWTDSGQYYIVATNASGTATSTETQVTVGASHE